MQYLTRCVMGKRPTSELSRYGFSYMYVAKPFFLSLHLSDCSLCWAHSDEKRLWRDASGLDLSTVLVATSYDVFMLASQHFPKSSHPITDADQKPQSHATCQLFWVLCHLDPAKFSIVGEKTHPGVRDENVFSVYHSFTFLWTTRKKKTLEKVLDTKKSAHWINS